MAAQPDTTPRRCGVLGHPVGHSLSPTLHRAAYRQLGIDDRYSYDLQDVDRHQIGAVVDRLDAHWSGLSVTMPLKQEVIEHLDLLAPTARLTHSVNTVVVLPGGPGLLGGELDAGPRPAGRPGLLMGANTDVYGIVATVREALGDQDLHRGVIIGGRATASSALVAMRQLGIDLISVVARSVTGPGNIMEVAERMDLGVGHVTFDDHAAIRRLLDAADVVVSTVPKGVADQLVPAIEGLDLDGKVLLDAVYDPWPTAVAGAWAAHRGTIAPGWVMLLHQAWLQVKLMTGGLEPDVGTMREAIVSEMARRAAGGDVEEYPEPFDLSGLPAPQG